MSAAAAESTFAVHVDCDNLWIYETEFGVPLSDHQDLIYTQALPTLLDVFARWNIHATFFVIGNELQRTSCVEFCRAAVARGHRLGNHSFSHRVDFARLPASEKRQEIIDADQAIRDATGHKPIGFRSPGYHIDRDIIATLIDSGYRYDSSILPGPAGLLMKVYMTMIGRGGNGKSFGPWTSVFASQRPHPVDAGARVWEFPIATFPRWRMPIHSTFVYRFGESLLDGAIARLKQTPGHHIYLLHAIDGLDYPSPGGLEKLVIPLQRTLSERRAFLDRLGALIEGRVALTEDVAAAS
jgi:peptidoglycan-N-acetylglucosamine deacetylase